MPQATTITNSTQRVLGLIDALLKDIPADRAARFANGADGPIHANHPVFIVGHLSIYNAKLIALLGQDPAPAAVPDTYDALFQFGVDCVDDADGSTYPSLEEVVGHLKRGAVAANAAVQASTEEQLDAPTPDENWREAFPTLGVMANFLLNDHTMFHLGQLSTWRRAEGLGSAM